AIDSKKMPHIGFRENAFDNYYDIFYTYKSEAGWSKRLQLGDNVHRGYVVQVAIDSTDRVHFAHGSTDPETNYGPIHYYIIQDNKIIFDQHDIMQIRGDERLAMDVTPQGVVELVTGDLSYPSTGGPIFYWRSSAPGEKLIYKGDIHSSDARGGSNGSPDLFIDAAGYVHVCYGAELDISVPIAPTVRYSRIKDGGVQRDTHVTDSGELEGQKFPVGIGSVAASEDAFKIVVAYLASETGQLYARLSQTGGATWEAPVRLADGWSHAEGRNKQIVRAYRSNFYVVYPSGSGIKLRHLKMTINQPPVAEIGGPYSGNEGTPVQFNASASSDPDGTIVKYVWDFQKDGVWDDTTATPIASHTYPDDFSGFIKLKVIDGEDDFATDSTTITISNVAPAAEAGGPYSGKWATNVNLSGSAVDPGAQDALTLKYEWDLDNDGIYESIGKSVQANYTRGERHSVWLRVTDDENGVGLDSAMVVISNEPPIVSQIPNQSIRKGESFKSIALDDYVTDPDNPDDQVIWTIANNNHVNIAVTNREAKVTVINANWVGSDTVLFIAKDTGDRADTSATVFSVTPGNQPPVLTKISEQTILENELFKSVNLDDYVNDPDNSDDQISWRFRGNQQLGVTIANRILQIAVADSEWAGSESVTFIATDPEGLKDSTTTIFTIVALNDPPVVTRIPNQTITPGNTFPPINLDDYVTDADNKDNEMTWTAFGAVQLQVQIVNHIATITVPSLDWMGSETIIFYAKDPWGLTGNSITVFAVQNSTDVAEENEGLPTKFALHPNFPNPFNPDTWISFDMPEISQVRISIYNRLGQKVRTLIDETRPAGRFQIKWNGTDDLGRQVSSGIYFYQIETDKYTATKKMILLM
ncbi:MAG: PKD domain-containing protein, partial [bacterium]|nr:PKD domain-containing protein [bacterium]